MSKPTNQTESGDHAEVGAEAAMDKFRRLTKGLLSVSRDELIEAERQYQADRPQRRKEREAEAPRR